MAKQRKITKTEWILLAMTVLFLLTLAVGRLYVHHSEYGGYEVTAYRSGASDAAERVNVNTASAEELEVLEGIGPELARRIVAYREENGPFTVPEDLLQVKGIGEKTLEKFADYITLEVDG